MNAFIGKLRYEDHIEKRNEKIDTKTLGDIIAVSLIGTYTLAALFISCWSAFLLLTGDTSNGGPIGMIVNKMLLFVLS